MCWRCSAARAGSPPMEWLPPWARWQRRERSRCPPPCFRLAGARGRDRCGLAPARARSGALWGPAHAVFGDTRALTAVVAFGFALLVIAIALFSGRFGEH